MDEHAPIEPSDPTSSIPPSDSPDAPGPVGPDFDVAGDPLPARTFAPGLDDEALGFSAAVRQPGGCPWCGAALPEPDLATCPTCGAALQPVAELPDIPGLTVAPAVARRTVGDISPDILALVTPPVTDAIAAPGDRPELEPPDPSVRRAMLELELEALVPGLAASLAAQGRSGDDTAGEGAADAATAATDAGAQGAAAAAPDAADAAAPADTAGPDAGPKS